MSCLDSIENNSPIENNNGNNMSADSINLDVGPQNTKLSQLQVLIFYKLNFFLFSLCINTLFQFNQILINCKIFFQKELAKEFKVKEGLERFFSLSVGNHLNPRAYTSDLLESSRDMYEDNKARITLLRMQIDRIHMKERSDVNSDNGQFLILLYFYLQFLEHKKESKNEIIIADLMYRLRKEVALATGAKNMLKILGEQKKPDLKSTKDALDTHAQAQEKIDLICLALKKYTLVLIKKFFN